MSKKAFVTKEQIEEIVKAYPTPFHIYDEKGIRENAQALKEAFSWNKGFKEYFAVKATPNPFLINILREYDCGCDCSSLTELMLSSAMGQSLAPRSIWTISHTLIFWKRRSGSCRRRSPAATIREDSSRLRRISWIIPAMRSTDLRQSSSLRDFAS